MNNKSVNELARLQALESYHVMDTLPQKEFDDITELASIICGTPISLISLLDSDRQWFKSKYGFKPAETPRYQAFCRYTIQSPDNVFVVEDSLSDERFRDNPLVTGAPHVRFYAGVPLVTPGGHALGSLCVMDHQPRTLTEEQRRALSLLSKRVMELLEARKAALSAEEVYRLSEHKFLALTEQSPDPIAVLNDALVFTYANRGFGKCSGMEMAGRAILDAICPEFKEEFVQKCTDALQHGRHASMDLRVAVEGADEKWMNFRVSPIREDNGLITSIMMVSADITDKVKAQEKERESKAYYESLFFNNPQAATLLNLDGTIEDINKSNEKVYGYAREEIIGKNFMEFINPSFSAQAAEAFQVALMGVAETIEGNALTKEGKTIEVSVTVIPVFVDGQLRKLQVLTSDITQARRTERLIKEQVETQSSIFESINEGFLALDHNRNIIFLNTVCATLLMKSKEELLYQPLFEVFPALQFTSLDQKCSEVEETGKHIHYRGAFPLSKFTLDIDIYPTPGGLAIHFLDVTEKIATQQDFDKLSFVASRVSNGVLILDKDHFIEWANDSFLQLIDCTLQEAKGNRLSQLLGEGNINLDTVSKIREKLKQGTPFYEEVEYTSKENRKFWLRADITPSFGETQDIKQYFIILSDYTPLKEAEDNLRQQAHDLFQQNKDLQEFTYVVSHNLRAPVAKAVGLTNTLVEVGKHTSEFDVFLDHLNKTMAQLDTVIKDMNMILSIRDRKDVVTRQPTNLAEVCQQALLEMQEPLNQCGGQVSVNIQEGLCVNGLKAYLYSIFHNLLSNAIKYRSDERALQIKIDGFGTADRGAIISFSDNGSGFDMQKAGPNIFKLYKRFHPKKEGRGIGLYLAKTHVEAMGGHIEVNSKVGKGTRFMIHLK